MRKAPENTFKFKINNIFFNNKEKSLSMISQEELLNSRFNSYKNILKKEIKYEKNINLNDNNKNLSNINNFVNKPEFESFTKKVITTNVEYDNKDNDKKI